MKDYLYAILPVQLILIIALGLMVFELNTFTVSGTSAAMLAGNSAGWDGIGAVVVAEGRMGAAGSMLVDLW
jgi:hypothetical protein